MIAVARRHPQTTFLGIALLINVAAGVMARAVSDPVRFRHVAVAASLDLTITVTAIYYWLVVRPGIRGRLSMVFIALLGLLRASFAFPSVIRGREFILAAAECAVVAVAILALRKARGGDPVERIQTALAGIIHAAPVSRAVAGELCALYYAFAWRARVDAPLEGRVFTLHGNSGARDLFLLVGCASLIEIPAAHLVASHWSRLAAWVLTGLGIYAAVWILAVWRSFRLRPGYVTGDEVLFRLGLLFSLRVPKNSIRAVGSHRESMGGDEVFVYPKFAEPNLFIGFTAPVTTERLFGLHRKITALGICADDPEFLLHNLKRG
ncbi:MAG TPA: hypothetical protein VKB79_17180 [Bryobacteraceae bacterium]|nr:hypothetical protein [Bryobacteraceae bacterium]